MKRFISSSYSLLSRKESLFLIVFVLLLILSLYFRTSGLFRGLGEISYTFHPDEPKQVAALHNYLNGEYVRYYGSLFYDGYPYGLNHLDEYILRPVLSLFQSDTPEISSLYYHARFLRLFYSFSILALCCIIINKITQKRSSMLLPLLILGISPISISITHFATGDIGVDLFLSLCLLCLLFFIDARNRLWLFFAGICIGGAFSSKYNGLLIGFIPFLYLLILFFQNYQFKQFLHFLVVLTFGSICGIFLFTPGFLIEFKTTLGNMINNFIFIKNYNVPEGILRLSYFDKAIAGIKNNFIYISSALGWTLFSVSCAGSLFLIKKAYTFREDTLHHRTRKLIFLVSLSVFPFVALLLSLAGKYVVQPFHFSYLIIPFTITTSYSIHILLSSRNILRQAVGIILLILLILEFGLESIKDNFFWRMEDNNYYSSHFPASVYDREAFYTHRSDTIRSLFLQKSGTSVFKNHDLTAKGPDGYFWNLLDVAPLPQVANPIGRDWIFLNGPSFPRNDRKFVIQAENRGSTVTRYIVANSTQQRFSIALESGSYGTEAHIDFGGSSKSVTLSSHEQKIIEISPRKVRVSGNESETVHIFPVTIYVPHDTLWVTVIKNSAEENIVRIFGGNQAGKAIPPEPLTPFLQENYYDALSRIVFLDLKPNWRVSKGKRLPMWEIAIPAGHYILYCDIEGVSEEAKITLEFEDAKGKLYKSERREYIIGKGIQRIEYPYTKLFTPFQAKLIVTGIEGECQMLRLKILPNFKKIQSDLQQWRTTQSKPTWMKHHF